MEQRNKVKELLASRKFWTSIISVLVTVGLFQFSDVQQNQLVESLVIVAPLVAGAVYSISTAIEDAAHAKAKGEVEVARLQMVQAQIQMESKRE